jgi:hypothetical protein
VLLGRLAWRLGSLVVERRHIGRSVGVDRMTPLAEEM